jgi:hypothetical protein
MELLNQELQLQSGEADAARGLVALNRAQDYFESMAALRARCLMSTTTVSQSASTETTARPSNLLRIDRLQLLDANSRPVGDITPLSRVGGQAGATYWPLTATATASTGKPYRYAWDKNYFYWQPLPDSPNVVRVYGLIAATDITADGTFLYDDVVILPMAGFACRLMKIGVDDNMSDVAGLAQESFKAVLDRYELEMRDGARGLEYTEIHSA